LSFKASRISVLASVGIQRQGAKTPRRNWIFFITKPGNQESSEKSHGFLASLCGIVLGRAFAPLRLCVKSFLHDGRLQSLAVCMVADSKVWPGARTWAKGQRPTQGRAGAGLASPAGIGAGVCANGKSVGLGLCSLAIQKWAKLR
jgi:hypothetical protein